MHNMFCTRRFYYRRVYISKTTTITLLYKFRKEIALHWINPKKFVREYNQLSFTPLSTRKRLCTAVTRIYYCYQNRRYKNTTIDQKRNTELSSSFHHKVQSTISTLTALSLQTAAATVNNVSLNIDGRLNR